MLLKNGHKRKRKGGNISSTLRETCLSFELIADEIFFKKSLPVCFNERVKAKLRKGAWSRMRSRAARKRGQTTLLAGWQAKEKFEALSSILLLPAFSRGKAN